MFRSLLVTVALLHSACATTGLHSLRGSANLSIDYNPLLGNDVDDATKAEVAKILNGILSTLSHGHRKPETKDASLAGIKGKVERKSMTLLRNSLKQQLHDSNSVNELIIKEFQKDCPFGYGCGGDGSGMMDQATKEKVAQILSGILTNLQGQH